MAVIPMGDLIAADSGKFYGLTYLGGQFSNGVLFEYDALPVPIQKRSILILPSPVDSLR